MRKIMCYLLAALLFSTTMLDSNTSVSLTAATVETEGKPTLKERLLEVPPGSMLQAKLRDKQKIRGRLGELDNEGFNLTSLQGGKVIKQKIAYADVKSFKKVEGNKAGHAVLYALAGIGVLVVVLVIVAAAKTD